MKRIKKTEINALRLARKFANMILDYSPCGTTPKAKVLAGIFERAILDACRELPENIYSAQSFDILEAREWLVNRRYEQYVKCLHISIDKINSAITKLCESMGWEKGKHKKKKKKNEGKKTEKHAQEKEKVIQVAMLAKNQPILYRDWEQSKNKSPLSSCPSLSNLNVARANAWLQGFEVARSMYA